MGHSASDSSLLSLLECRWLLLQLSRRNGWHFVDKVLLILKRFEFDFCNFQEVFKTQNGYPKLASKRSHRDLMGAGFTREPIDVEKYGRNWTPVLYKEDVLEILQGQGLVIGEEKVFFCSSESESSNEDRIKYHPISFFGQKMVRERLHSRWYALKMQKFVAIRSKSSKQGVLLVFCSCTRTKLWA